MGGFFFFFLHGFWPIHHSKKNKNLRLQNKTTSYFTPAILYVVFLTLPFSIFSHERWAQRWCRNIFTNSIFFFFFRNGGLFRNWHNCAYIQLETWKIQIQKIKNIKRYNHKRTPYLRVSPNVSHILNNYGNEGL